MPATRTQIANIERFYYKIEEICKREGYAWEPILKESNELEASHRKSDRKWGVSKPVAIKLRIVTYFFEMLTDERSLPLNIRDILSCGILQCCIAALIIKYKNKLLEAINPISSETAIHVMREFLKNNSFAEIIFK